MWLEEIGGGRVAEKAEQVEEAALEVQFGLWVHEKVHVHFVDI